MQQAEMVAVLTKVAHQYPPAMVAAQLRDIPRIAFSIKLAMEAAERQSPENLSVCDLGGGVGLFSVGCAALGFRRVVLVDDFQDAVNRKSGDSVLQLHRTYSVEVVSRDVVSQGIADLGQGFDVISSFDSMEHWHNSPKKLFQQVFTALKPGGAFVLGVPNCVNLRKRMTVPLGIGKWSSLHDWYEEETFRGHVREPDIEDLHYIARDMGLTSPKIIGRNWAGYYSSNRAIRTAVRVLDYPLRAMPSLCADLYMVATKPL